jgi:hypothetical protein
MKWFTKKFLLIAFIGILAVNIALTVKANFNQNQQPRIIQQMEPQGKHEYIISEKLIKSKLQMKSQIVSLKQNFDKKDTYVDSSFLGERDTQLTVHGTYQFGLNTKDIRVEHIDNSNGIVYIHMGSPVLINLDIPFDSIKFDKTKGFLRLAMSEQEQKKFYKATEKQIERDLLHDKELQKQADIFNQQNVKDILKLVPGVKDVVFQ